MPISSIPDWYADDWTPARASWELPQMTWNAVEAFIGAGPLSPERKAAATTLYRALWMMRETLTPVDLLQRFLMTTALAFDPAPARPRPSAVTTSLIPATGPLPRWSFTDLEVVLSYTWPETALMVAIERHHDLLERRGERLTPIQTVRQIVLLVSGLPTGDLFSNALMTSLLPPRIRVAA